MRRTAILPLCLISLSLLPACAFILGEAKPPKGTRVKATTVRMEDGKQQMIVASSREDGGLFFTRPPYEMNGSWRVETTCGAFDARRLDAIGDTVFGLEADLIATGHDVSEFYGVYARRFETPTPGLQVFCSSEDGNHGQVFFEGATVADLAIENDGATITYLARDAVGGGTYETVGSRSMQTPAQPHYPGFGMFGAPKGATVGFTNFRVPQNGALPAGRPAETVALQALYEATFEVLDAGYALAGPTIATAEVTTADDALARAENALATARARIEAIPADAAKRKAKKTPVQLALSSVDKAERELAKSRKQLDKKGARAAKSVLKSITKKLFREAFRATDALLPDDVRGTLPGNGLDW